MNNKNRLSFSAIKTYQECGQKFDYRYNQRLRTIYPHGALLFGSAIDAALNTLLTSQDISKALETFAKLWERQQINHEWVELNTYHNIVYAESDFDQDLLEQDAWNDILEFGGFDTKDKAILHYKKIFEEKKALGWANVDLLKQQFYNLCNWWSLFEKGIIMLASYDREILPKITKVLAVQKENYLENSNGDKIVQYLDLIVEWIDGRIILFDNKTSAREYEADSALRSPQLISYFNGAKEEYKLDSVGFIVLSKHILKNKKKICAACGYDGSGERHKTCPNETVKSKRCGGEWNTSIDPRCHIDIIINKVSETAEQLVLQAFDEANTGISNKTFHKNLNSCKNGAWTCEYFQKCYFGNEKDLIVVEKKNEKT